MNKISVLVGGNPLANREAQMRTPMAVQARISIGESPTVAFRTQPQPIMTQMTPSARSRVEARTLGRKPRVVVVTPRRKLLEEFPISGRIRRTVKKNLQMVTRRL